MALGDRVEEHGDVVALRSGRVLPPTGDEGVDAELDGDEDGKRQQEESCAGEPARIGEEDEQGGNDPDERKVPAEGPPGAALIEAAKDVGGVNHGERRSVRVLEGLT